jgi:glycosyltransferase involved in cell wall biosynthesis
MLIAIVPAYNEEKTIGSVVRSLFGLVDKVVVIDDGSKDKTSVEANLAGATVLKHKINRGQGAALQTGQTYTLLEGADYVLHFDADGQFDPQDIKPALNALQASQADILFGSRFLGKKSNIPFFKKSFLFPLGRIVNKVLG